MGVEISYMGTKRRLASVVSDIVQRLPRGPFLDVFAGMCAVGEAISPTRQVWANDVQTFPAIVAKALFCSKSGPIPSDRIKRILEPAFLRNLRVLEDRFGIYLVKERKYFATGTLDDVIAGNTNLPYVGNDERLERDRQRLTRKTDMFPYRLATITYAGSYFGAKQCMEIDSLRYAIDVAAKKENIDTEQRDWLIIALGKVLSRINNSTGQFAQYIRPKRNNLKIIVEKRRRSVWTEFFTALQSISPLGTAKWRSRNRTFCSDAISLLSRMNEATFRPTIIYADPPYSSAQYSRYYHVLDTLVEYRYPPAKGLGRYPDKRFQTPFAQSKMVLKSVAKLVESAANLNACLVLSYPENGLFSQQGGNIVELLKCYYKKVEVAYSGKQLHSTFGGSWASPKISVTENIYVGCV